MKQYLIISILLVGSHLTVAQTISGQAFAEQTVMGFQKGYGLRYQTSKGLGIGVLFQSNGKLSMETADGNYPFYGIETILPITSCNNMRFFISPKIGFVNQDFLVLIPQVETEIKVTNSLSVGITTGLRARQSSAGGKVILHL
ncbi:MAG: hypothetical protein ABJG78_03285 [Cyclobacteriaceae bacterium]